MMMLSGKNNNIPRFNCNTEFFW